MAITSKRRGSARSYFTKMCENVCRIISISFKVGGGWAHSKRADFLEILAKIELLSRDKGPKIFFMAIF